MTNGLVKYPKCRIESAGKRSCGAHIASTRQIPVGKALLISRRISKVATYLEAKVTRNGENDFTVKFAEAINAAVGEMWNFQYTFGWFVWAFEAQLAKADGCELTFDHAEKIHCTNRRRFLRVGVNRKAYVALLPFAASKALKAPEFVDGRICELAGPGLLIETALEANIDDRVLVSFEAAENTIVQDVGEIRHITARENGFAMAVELVGLTDENVNELAQLTNAAAKQMA